MSRYRTPGNSEFVEALGWAVWNFLYLEETIVRWLWLLEPDRSLSEHRAQTAFGKGVELGKAVKRACLPSDLVSDLQQWLRRYEAAVQGARNAVTHAHPYTVEMGRDGWVPGLAYTDIEQREHTIAESPGDLHEIALKIEQITTDLSGMESRLQSHLAAARELSSGPPQLGE